MIQSIGNSSTNLDPVQALSSQISKNTTKKSHSPGLSHLSSSTQDIVLKETLHLFKGIAIDLLRAALTSLLNQAPTSEAGTTKESAPAPTDTPVTTNPAPTVNLDAAPTTTVTPTDTSPPRKNESLSSFLQRELKPNGEGNFHEEQLQYGVVGYLLNERSPALYKQFESSYAKYKSEVGSRSSFEDGVKVALKELVSSKNLTKQEAEDINGKSFRAAQLDKDVATLFDDKGGPKDSTIAVLNSKEAAEKVDRAYGRIRRGETNAPSRSLDAPSNTKANSLITKSASSAGNGFLWKPISESDSKLAILTPSGISDEVESVSIFKVDSGGKKSLIEKGRSSGSTEGRAVFRFKQAGAQYPDGTIVEIKLKGGEIVTETISETSNRVEE